jgi:hypothetical protein
MALELLIHLLQLLGVKLHCDNAGLVDRRSSDLAALLREPENPRRRDLSLRRTSPFSRAFFDGGAIKPKKFQRPLIYPFAVRPGERPL